MQKQLALAWAEIAKLKQEIYICRRTVTQAIDIGLIQKIPDGVDLTVPDEEPESWTERSARFSGLRSMLLKVTVNLCKAHGCAVHQDEILRAFKARNPTFSAGLTSFGETCSRRLRELRSEGYLTSPQQGYFFLGARTLKLEQTVPTI